MVKSQLFLERRLPAPTRRRSGTGVGVARKRGLQAMKRRGPWGAGGSPRGPGRLAPLLKANSRAVARRRDQQRSGCRGEVYEYCVVQAVAGVTIVAVDGASETRVAELANRRAARSVSPAAAPSMLVVIVVPFMFAASPLPLFRPLASPLLMPARGLVVVPLAPVFGRDMVIARRDQ